MTILDEWNITAEQLTEMLDANPSLRGMLLGYAAEVKLKEIITSFPEVCKSHSKIEPDDGVK